MDNMRLLNRLNWGWLERHNPPLFAQYQHLMEKARKVKMETSNNADDAESLIAEAYELLQRHHLNDAEKLFYEALQRLAKQDDNESNCKAYVGLAQIYTKKGRYCKGDESEWHRYYLQALTMQRHAKQVSKSNEDINQVTQHMNMVRDMYIETLKSRLIPPTPFRPHLPPSYRSTNKVKLNSQWLHGLQTHIKNKLNSPSVSPALSVSTSEEFKPDVDIDMSKKNKLDFNRVRKAIMRMVKQISKDMRARHIRKHLPEQTLKRAVSSEMLCMLTPQNENMDVISLFESYIIDESPELMLPGRGTQDESVKLSSTDSEEYSSEEYVFNNNPSTKNGGSARPTSLPADIISAHKLQDSAPQKCISLVSEGCIQGTKSPLSSKPCTVYGKRNVTQMTGYEPDFRLPGVLRIWRGHKQRQRPIMSYLPHKLHFEEMSPLTENGKYQFEEETKNENTAINEPKISVTLAILLSQIGDKFKEENQLSYANELYTYALGIFQANEAHITSHECISIAHLLKSLGAIRCAKEDFIGGSQLMEEAVEMYRKYHDSDENIDIVSVWYELGTAYMSEQCSEDNFLECVMSAVKDHIDGKGDTIDDKVDYTSDSDESDSSDGDSYSLHVHEARCILNYALQMIRTLRRQKKVLDNDLYVAVLSRMADCCIMLGDYQKATLCYEEALVLFKTIIGSPSLSLNAHVLSMLGVSNFLLGNYPKAIRMFETAQILQKHLYGRNQQFKMAFTLTMLGISSDIVGRHDKCVAWCLRAHEMYSTVFKDILKVSLLQQWFRIQTVYTLGYAYSCSHMCEKALHYLDISQKMVLRSFETDIKHPQQIVHILKLMADVYALMEKPEEALTHYEGALQYAQKLGNEKRSSTLQNQLFNRMAGIHVTTKDYNTAAKCLEQALDYQKNMQSSIKGDMFGMMHSLGLTYTLSGDIDKAIDCYKDAIEAYHEMHGGSPGIDLAEVYGRIATLYHVKACLEEDEEDILEYDMLVEKFYNDAVSLDYLSPIVVQQANFQYQQGQTPDALLTMIGFLWRCSSNCENIMYNGPEQAVLPIHLQQDLDDVDEVILNAKIFGHFLAILCYKELGLIKDADDSLVYLYKLVMQTGISINYSILGYALMEMDLLEDAAEIFLIAFDLDNDTTNAYFNFLTCLTTAAFQVLYRGLYNVWEKYFIPFETSLIVPHAVPQTSVSDIMSSDNSCTKENIQSEPFYPTRDSGYYDSAESTIFRKLTSSCLTSPTEEYNGIFSSASCETMDGGCTSRESLQINTPLGEYHSECLNKESVKENIHSKPIMHDILHSGISFDENSNIGIERGKDSDQQGEDIVQTVVETPIEILKILQKQQTKAQEQDKKYTQLAERCMQENSESVNQQLKKPREEYNQAASRVYFSSECSETEKEDTSKERTSKAEFENPREYPEEIWYAKNYLADNIIGNQTVSDADSKEEKDCLTEVTSKIPHPLDQTIQDLQYIAEETMDISPQDPYLSETWDEQTGQWIKGNTIDDLLKESRELEDELEESLRSLESRARRQGGDQEVTGWRAATSARTQEILASIQNNNNTAHISSGTPNTSSAEKSQEIIQDEEANIQESIEEEEEWQVWEEEEVVETPSAILALLQAQTALKQ